MSRPSKAVTQAKKVAPPAVPSDFRHSGSSFGSAGYASSEDGSCFLPGGLQQHGSGGGNNMNLTGVGGNGLGAPGSSGPNSGGGDDGSYSMPAGKSPGPIFSHPGFSFPTMVGKYAQHSDDQGIFYNYLNY